MADPNTTLDFNNTSTTLAEAFTKAGTAALPTTLSQYGKAAEGLNAAVANAQEVSTAGTAAFIAALQRLNAANDPHYATVIDAQQKKEVIEATPFAKVLGIFDSDYDKGVQNARIDTAAALVGQNDQRKAVAKELYNATLVSAEKGLSSAAMATQSAKDQVSFALNLINQGTDAKRLELTEANTRIAQSQEERQQAIFNVNATSTGVLEAYAKNPELLPQKLRGKEGMIEAALRGRAQDNATLTNAQITARINQISLEEKTESRALGNVPDSVIFQLGQALRAVPAGPDAVQMQTTLLQTAGMSPETSTMGIQREVARRTTLYSEATKAAAEAEGRQLDNDKKRQEAYKARIENVLMFSSEAQLQNAVAASRTAKSDMVSLTYGGEGDKSVTITVPRNLVEAKLAQVEKTRTENATWMAENAVPMAQTINAAEASLGQQINANLANLEPGVDVAEAYTVKPVGPQADVVTSLVAGIKQLRDQLADVPAGDTATMRIIQKALEQRGKELKAAVDANAKAIAGDNKYVLAMIQGVKPSAEVIADAAAKTFVNGGVLAWDPSFGVHMPGFAKQFGDDLVRAKQEFATGGAQGGKGAAGAFSMSNLKAPPEGVALERALSATAANGLPYRENFINAILHKSHEQTLMALQQIDKVSAPMWQEALKNNVGYKQTANGLQFDPNAFKTWLVQRAVDNSNKTGVNPQLFLASYVNALRNSQNSLIDSMMTGKIPYYAPGSTKPEAGARNPTETSLLVYALGGTARVRAAGSQQITNLGNAAMTQLGNVIQAQVEAGDMDSPANQQLFGPVAPGGFNATRRRPDMPMLVSPAGTAPTGSAATGVTDIFGRVIDEAQQAVTPEISATLRALQEGLKSTLYNPAVTAQARRDGETLEQQRQQLQWQQLEREVQNLGSRR